MKTATTGILTPIAQGGASPWHALRVVSGGLTYQAAYRVQQAALLRTCVAIQQFVRAIALPGAPSDSATITAIQRRYRELLERDLQNVERGLYPASSLFRIPVAEYIRRLPQLALEVPRILLRARREGSQELPEGEELSRYPEYFRRNFHWQTDGYLSRRSAELYDLSVEFLFLGAADVMRRQVLAPIAEQFQAAPRAPRRVLDVGCGSGATLRQMAHAYPAYQYYGLDLSPFYIREARRKLRDVGEITLIAGNAERMAFRDNYFDAVTSVYLFHELPKDARRNVIREMHRVLRPGGMLVIEDSAQLTDAEDIAVVLERFMHEMHEPYYRSYIRDDLATCLTEQGFTVQRVDPCYVAKLVVATKI